MTVSVDKIPLVSIITPSLNNGAYIGEAIESVRHQNYPKIEHIIVDGGSTDNTLDLLSKYKHIHLVFENEQKGVYYANNQGIQTAQGEIIGILNADDIYEPNILSGIVHNFLTNENLDVISGGATFFYQDEKKPPYTWFPNQQGNPLEQALGMPLINACFFRKHIFNKTGLFNTYYRLAGDRELLIRFALYGIRLFPQECIFYRYRLHDTALTSNPNDLWHIDSRLERLKICECYLKNPVFSISIRNELRTWHGQNTAWLVRAYAEQRHISELIRYALRGLRYNLGWLGIYRRLFIPPITHIHGYLFRWITKQVQKYQSYEKNH